MTQWQEIKGLAAFGDWILTVAGPLLEAGLHVVVRGGTGMWYLLSVLCPLGIPGAVPSMLSIQHLPQLTVPETIHQRD